MAPPWAGSPVREALPARGQQRAREQEAQGLWAVRVWRHSCAGALQGKVSTGPEGPHKVDAGAR